MPETKTVASKYITQLIIWGLLLLPFSWLADCVLDGVIFGSGDFIEQLLDPEYHEICIRLLFWTFIVAAVALGVHYLTRSARLEKVLRERNEDLVLANQEMEEYSLTLANELRNVLTELCSSATLLKEQCLEQKDEKTLFLTEKVFSYSDALERQIDPIMKLSLVASGDLQRKEARLDHLVREITEKILSTQANDRIEIRVEPKLTAWCDPKLMHLALENLLSNAVKYIPGDRKGLIEFGHERRFGQTVFFVRDNGIGFDEERAAHIFDTFDRDPGNSPDGSEISLVSVRRIIQRHGGQIWAEAIPDAGATFFFTLH